jgi:hypothetical protein
VGEVLFAEADAGVGGGRSDLFGGDSGGHGGVGVEGVFEGGGVVRSLDVDEVEAGGVAVVDELAEADFGGVGDEAVHGFGNEDAGEDDAEEGADEADTGTRRGFGRRGRGEPGFDGAEEVGGMEGAVDVGDGSLDPGMFLGAAEVAEDGFEGGVVADGEARGGAAGDATGAGGGLGIDGEDGADGAAVPEEDGVGGVEVVDHGEEAGGVTLEEGKGGKGGRHDSIPNGNGVTHFLGGRA